MKRLTVLYLDHTQTHCLYKRLCEKGVVAIVETNDEAIQNETSKLPYSGLLRSPHRIFSRFALEKAVHRTRNDEFLQIRSHNCLVTHQ